MTDILAVFRVEDMDIALTETIAHDESAVISPVHDVGTDPESDRYLFSVTSDDFGRFESGLEVDHTVATYERVVDLDGEAIYAFTYNDHAVLISTEIGHVNGVVLNMGNEGTTWLLDVWFPDRAAATHVWEYAIDHGIDIELLRINEYGSITDGQYGLTDAQREAVLVALDMGYFEEPREATLEDVAGELGISQPAAGGLLRRGIGRLVTATVAESGE